MAMVKGTERKGEAREARREGGEDIGLAFLTSLRLQLWASHTRSKARAFTST